MKRVILKISGEALGDIGFSPEKSYALVQEIIKAKKNSKIEIAIVIGGGNIWRKRDSEGFAFAGSNSDAIGMGATVLNAAVLRNILVSFGVEASVFSPHPFSDIAQRHSVSDEREALLSGRVVIFAGGTGAPFFTTDSAAVVRALEIQADAVFKGTKVSGVYDSDPKKNPNARRFDSLSFTDALENDLQIMDATAFALARENNLPLFVFDAFAEDGIVNALSGKGAGTWVGKN